MRDRGSALARHRSHARRLARRLRLAYLKRPGLIRNLLALVAFFSIGFV